MPERNKDDINISGLIDNLQESESEEDKQIGGLLKVLSEKLEIKNLSDLTSREIGFNDLINAGFELRERNIVADYLAERGINLKPVQIQISKVLTAPIKDISAKVLTPPIQSSVQSLANPLLEKFKARERMKDYPAGNIIAFLPHGDKEILQAYISQRGINNVAELYDKLREGFIEGLRHKLVNLTLEVITKNYLQSAQSKESQQHQKLQTTYQEERRGFIVTFSEDNMGIDIDGQRAITTTYCKNNERRENYLNYVKKVLELYSNGLNPDSIKIEVNRSLQDVKVVLGKAGLINYGTSNIPVASGNNLKAIKGKSSPAPPRSIFEDRP